MLPVWAFTTFGWLHPAPKFTRFWVQTWLKQFPLWETPQFVTPPLSGTVQPGAVESQFAVPLASVYVVDIEPREQVLHLVPSD